MRSSTEACLGNPRSWASSFQISSRVTSAIMVKSIWKSVKGISYPCGKADLLSQQPIQNVSPVLKPFFFISFRTCGFHKINKSKLVSSINKVIVAWGGNGERMRFSLALITGNCGYQPTAQRHLFSGDAYSCLSHSLFFLKVSKGPAQSQVFQVLKSQR